MKKTLLSLLLACIAMPAVHAEESTLAGNSKLHWITLSDAAFQQLKKINPALSPKHSASLASDASGLPTGKFSAHTGEAEKVHAVQVTEAQMLALSEKVHHELKRCGGFMFHPNEAAARTALSTPVKQGLAATRPSYKIANQALVKAILPTMQDSNIAQTIIDLTNFTNRYYQSQGGVNSSNWLLQKWKTMAQGRSDISAVQFKHSSWAQPSVILTIQGTDRASEVVVLGAHLDSISMNGTSETTRAPGADDDASGIASMTEVLRAMIANKYKPRRTIKMIAYAAEEVGLRGSQEIATSFANAKTNVVGVMQLDMTNYKGGANDIYLFTDYTDNAQNTFIGNLIATYLPGVKVGSDKCGYACSDHASWSRLGYAASMPFESPMNAHNPHIHTANDTFANSGNQAQHALKFARMAAAFAIELGSEGAVTPPSGTDKTETFSGSLARGAKKSFGPFKAAAGSLKAITSGTGDIDMYVKKGSAASSSSYDCRSVGSTASESCSVNLTANGDVYLQLTGYTAGTYKLSVTYKTQK
ncbi:M20/M25/M40 family metallo-hydrolase [Massilia sp. W12]|uniref:M20/M25/M40 family metallo-hydrolase n=1 Tax=Massilia sp. W12 TaxID=3126507 RepID=UPI0030D04DBF